MTKEEALDIIRFVFLQTDNHLDDDRQISAEDIHEALVMACAALCKNSLPSNLDEAAEKYSNIPGNFGDFFEIEYEFGEPIETIVDDKVFVKDAFKAGANWRDAEVQRYFQAQIEQELKRLEDPSYKGTEKDVEIAAELWALDHIQETEHRDITKAFCAGAEWMAGQGWIDDGSMPPETKQESDTLQGHRELTESEPVLAWDSIYGCRVDWTRNGKWMSEQTGGYTGQVCHGIIAWMPIPKYKEKH